MEMAVLSSSFGSGFSEERLTSILIHCLGLAGYLTLIDWLQVSAVNVCGLLHSQHLVDGQHATPSFYSIGCCLVEDSDRAQCNR